MSLKICDDSQAIRAVQSYIARIRNAEKRRYADDLWSALYRESAGQGTDYPNAAAYRLGAMGAQSVRNRISETIEYARSK